MGLEIGGEETVEAGGEEFALGEAEEPFGSRVEEEDAGGLIDADDRVGGRLHDGAEGEFGVTKGFLEDTDLPVTADLFDVRREIL